MYCSLKSPVEIGFPSRLILIKQGLPYNLWIIAAAVSSFISHLENSIWSKVGLPMRMSTNAMNEKGSV